MAAQTWTFFDQARSEHNGYKQSYGKPPFFQEKGLGASNEQLKIGLSAGVEVVYISNGRLTLYVLPTRGMSIWRANFDSESIRWKLPIRGPVHPQHVPLSEPSGDRKSVV